MRVYVLSREIHVEGKAVIRTLKANGFGSKGLLSLLTAEQVEFVKEKLRPKYVFDPNAEPLPPERPDNIEEKNPIDLDNPLKRPPRRHRLAKIRRR